MKYTNNRTTYITGSIKGFSVGEEEVFNQTVYCYIKVIIDGKVYYYGDNGALTDQPSAKVFTEKAAKRIARKLNDKYSKVIIFRTTKKL